MPYPEAIHLPFNGHVIRESYVPAKPGEQETGEPGFWVIIREDLVVFRDRDGELSLFEGELPELMKNRGEQVTIGKWKGRPLRLLRMGGDNDLPPGFSAEPLLLLFLKERIGDELLTVTGLAQQIGKWERNSVMCPRCGGGTGRIDGTWGKKCVMCGYEHFPNVYPCTIALVKRGDSLLMIRKPEWPEGYYSLPSGFCDLGECLEECVVREVEEETGIRVKNMRYMGSQSWPFPSQLMAAFSAEYESGGIVVDTNELEDARWFDKDALPPTFSGKSIAGWLIRRFMGL
jgi:NAD+ diphosphatase